MKTGTILMLAGGILLSASCSQPATGVREELEDLWRLRVEVTAPQPGLEVGKPKQENESGAASATEALQLRAVNFLQEHAPELNTHGPSDGWTLKVQLYWQYEYLPRNAAKVPDRWVMSDVRLVRPAVVDGRKALVVIYEGSRYGPARDRSLVANHEPNPGPMEDELDARLEEFIAAWSKANRGRPAR